MKQEANMEHSAEWLRGAVEALEKNPRNHAEVDCLLSGYRRLLAAAEAREAGPTAAEVIAKCKEFLVAISLDMPEKIDERMRYRDYQFWETELLELNDALAAIAAWEATNDR